jgi:phenylalanine-4-hydroxylase
VTTEADFHLPADHPGFSDPDYRRRRARIAEVGERFRPGDPIPDVGYTPDEDRLWATIVSELGPRHERLATPRYRHGWDALGLPTDRVPQLREVDRRLSELTGWGIRPVPGLVPVADFYGSLADRRFMSTQYVRHHSVPFYTPEPDVVHELIGHAASLAVPEIAELHRLAGVASRAVAHDHEALSALSSVFWFTIEFGVVWQDGELRAFGAGILSSFAELETFRTVELRPFDLEAMASTSYDISDYQPLLFAAPSYGALVDELGSWFAALA